jgi:predicted NUDIX family NTP pyrophosphohydrolase
MSRKHQSAGLLLFRRAADAIEVLLVHPGGPFWAKKDEGAWSIPKGEFADGEDPLQAALREFEEETGQTVGKTAADDFIPLQPQRQAGGKLVYAWALRGDFDPTQLRSNTFSIEWPPRSGRQQTWPEVDRASWFTLDAARKKILPGQLPLLDELERNLTSG